MTQAMRRASVTRRLRSLGGRVIRSLGLLPGGAPDGLGEDDALTDLALGASALVYFADTRDGLYQLEQWYGPLQELHERMGVVVVCADSRAAAAVRERSGLRVLTIARDTTLERLVRESDVAIALYVNYNPLNTLCLRFAGVVHISLLHGDSDKAVSVSNQVKAYDYSFVAGRAAVDRYRARTMLFDADARCLVIGRPQLDTALLRAERPDGGRTTVLYAPTWEGASDAVGYGSVVTHGAALVQALLDAGFAVRYRPHPLTGVRDGGYGEADARVREVLREANQADTGVAAVSHEPTLEADFARSDLLVADVSAVAIDWLPTGRPLLITTPASAAVSVVPTPLLELVPRLSVDDLDRVGAIVATAVDEDPIRQERARLTEYYLGDTDPGAAAAAFLDTCERLAALARESRPGSPRGGS